MEVIKYIGNPRLPVKSETEKVTIMKGKQNFKMESGLSNAKLGLRVVRGPDWRYDNQIASGLIGTVVEIDGQSGSSAPAKTVAVIWDTGDKCFYRAGYENAYDLRIYENVQCGVVHEFTSCNGCEEKEIVGLRWKCADCPTTDLCSRCYMSDKHDIAHTFIRYETRLSSGIRVPLRCNSQNDKRLAKGIFKGAIVSRGQDWSAGNQDGGAGKTGQVVDITKWGDVFVRWMSGNVYPYRLGSSGKVELKLAKRCFGNIYYKSHLPVVGALGDGPIVNNCFERDRITTAGKGYEGSESTNPTGGERCETKGADISSAGNPQSDTNNRANSRRGTASNAGRINTIDVAAQASVLGPPPPVATVPPPAQKGLFKVGDKVKISVKYSRLTRLQEGHGGFPNFRIIKHLKKVGTVLSIYDNGDVNVKLGDSGPYMFNPNALSKVLDSPAENPAPANVRGAPAVGGPECTICVQRIANVAFAPCGHVACCQLCSRLFGSCPICRGDVKSCLRIFVP